MTTGPPTTASQTAVTFEGVDFTYPGAAAPALEGVSLTVRAGERLGILGPNGGGKSTLVRLALGLIRPNRGTIRLLGLSPAQARAAGLVGYVPQRPAMELSAPLSVRQVIELGASWRLNPLRRLGRAERARIDALVEMVGVRELLSRPIGTLSGGQLQRALIARALAGGPRVLALDEPTVGIDAVGQARFAELLRTLHAQLGLTVLIVSHDLRAVAAGCDRVACLSRRLHFHDSPSGLTPEVLAEVFSHDLAGLAGVLGSMHIHAHAADACGHAHHHPAPGVAPGCASAGVPLTIAALSPTDRARAGLAPADPAPPAPPTPGARP